MVSALPRQCGHIRAGRRLCRKRPPGGSTSTKENQRGHRAVTEYSGERALLANPVQRLLELDPVEDHDGGQRVNAEVMGRACCFPTITEPDKTVAELSEMSELGQSDPSRSLSRCLRSSSLVGWARFTGGQGLTDADVFEICWSQL